MPKRESARITLVKLSSRSLGTANPILIKFKFDQLFVCLLQQHIIGYNPADGEKFEVVVVVSHLQTVAAAHLCAAVEQLSYPLVIIYGFSFALCKPG